MIARVQIDGAWMWSAWQPDRGITFNSYLFERGGGFVAVDPLPLDESSADEIARRGGVHTIVVTNRDHVRGAQALRERFDARIVTGAAEASLLGIAVDATFHDRDEVFPGAYAVAIPHGK